jgi:gluconate kinase
MTLSEIDNKIYNQLLSKLQNRDVPNPTAGILFSGIPGCGKTTLAQRLARDLHAQYLQNDAIRNSAERLGLDKYDVHPVGRALTETIASHDANKLIVFDASINRTWQETIAFCKENGLTPIVVRITIDPREAITRLQKRGRHDDTQLIEATYRRLAQFEACKKALPADIEVTVPFDYQEVLQAVKKRLTQL